MSTGESKPYIYQEFKCNKCPGFFVIRLNRNIRGKVLIQCPMCPRKHQRDVINGVIQDIGKDSDETKMHVIRVPKAAFSKDPKTRTLEHAHKKSWRYHQDNRGGVPITKPDDLIDPTEFYKYV